MVSNIDISVVVGDVRTEMSGLRIKLKMLSDYILVCLFNLKDVGGETIGDPEDEAIPPVTRRECKVAWYDDGADLVENRDEKEITEARKREKNRRLERGISTSEEGITEEMYYRWEESFPLNAWGKHIKFSGSEETLQKFLRVLFPNDVDKENDTEPQQQLRKEIESTGYRGVLPHKSGQ
ncbi:hypothetical protein J6590_089889 [Homalodisca vitripennis]|nr:hypothetical protein J6590_089889 [Homalodisca vitripennis]